MFSDVKASIISKICFGLSTDSRGLFPKTNVNGFDIHFSFYCSLLFSISFTVLYCSEIILLFFTVLFKIMSLSFPLLFVFEGNKTDLEQIIGNAVPGMKNITHRLSIILR